MPSKWDIRYPAGEMNIRGQEIPIFVGATDAGAWYGTIGGTEYSADTKEDLRARLMTASRKAAARVAVPFVRIDPSGKAHPGTATGVHAGNGNVLVTWERTGRSEQIDPPSRYRNETHFKPVSAEEVAEIHRLQEARRVAVQELEDYLKPRIIDLKSAISAETDRKVQEMAQRERAAAAE